MRNRNYGLAIKNKINFLYLFLNVWNTWNGKKYPYAEVILFLPFGYPLATNILALTKGRRKTLPVWVQMQKPFPYQMAHEFHICHQKFCHDKRNSFTLHSTIKNEIYFGSIQKRSNKILVSLCFRRPCVPTATAYWAAGVFSIFDATHRSESGPSIAKGLRLESDIAIQFIAGLSWSRKFCLGDIFKGLLKLLTCE